MSALTWDEVSEIVSEINDREAREPRDAEQFALSHGLEVDVVRKIGETFTMSTIAEIQAGLNPTAAIYVGVQAGLSMGLDLAREIQIRKELDAFTEGLQG